MKSALAKKLARTGRLNLRATKHQADLIRVGANTKGVSVTEFILESACLQAEHAIADQREFVVSAQQWKAFTEALDRPAQIKSELVRLFRETRGKTRKAAK